MSTEASSTRPDGSKRATLVLDETHGVVLRRGRSIRLGAREAVILRTLLDAGGRVVSARSLALDGWGRVPPDAVRRVRNAVGRLRSKLGPPEVIETIVGEGYRLATEERPVRESSLSSPKECTDVQRGSGP